MPDAAGNIKGISLAGVSNAWLDKLKIRRGETELERGIRLEQEMFEDLIEREHLRGIVPPEF